MYSEYLVNYILIETKKVHDEANHVDHEPERESCRSPFVVIDVRAIGKGTGELN